MGASSLKIVYYYIIIIKGKPSAIYKLNSLSRGFSFSRSSFSRGSSFSRSSFSRGSLFSRGLCFWVLGLHFLDNLA